MEPLQTTHDDSFDVPGYIVRVRRLADLSQREAAARLEISAAGIARLESGTRAPQLGLLRRILRLAGLRLAVVDAAGREVDPVSAVTARDNADRRFPAHLDVQPPDQIPSEALRGPRYDRPPVRAWYHQRAERDRMRAVSQRGNPDPPPDHPTTTELAERVRLMRGRQPRVAPPPLEVRCDCEDPCYLSRCCLPSCPCQCEPAQASHR